MKFSKKLFVIPTFICASVAIISTAISCQDNDKFLVTFHAGDGHTINKNSTYCYKTKYIEYEPAPDDKIGTAFLGWKKNSELKGDYYTFPLQVTQNLDFYADYNVSKNMYVVSFNTYDGSSVPNYNVNEGDKIVSEPQTNKKDYVFNGWKLKADDTECVKFPFIPKENTTLHASWTKIDKHYLTCHTNGGTQPDPNNTEAVSGKTYTYKYKNAVKEVRCAPTSTRNGYNLVGWYLDESLQTRINFNTEPLILNDNLDIYAKWELITTSGYTVTLYDGSKVFKTIDNTTKIAYEPDAGVKEGYKFDGWYKEPELQNKVVFTGEGVDITSNVSWYAKWVKNEQCNIQLKDVDGTNLGDAFDLDKGKIIDSPFAYPDTATYKKYGNFIGWKNGTTLITYPYTIPEVDNLVLTASVDITSCNINIYDSEDKETIIKSLGNVKSIDKTPQIYKADRPEDYDFDHLFYLNSSQQEVTVTIDESHPFVVKDHLDLISNHEIKLYAAWKSETRRFRVTLKYGSEVTPTETILNHQKKTLTPKELPRVSFTDGSITGWKNIETTIVYPADSETSLNLSKDTTFEAVWTYTHRSIKVKRHNGVINVYNHLPVKLSLSNVPIGSKPYSKTIGYKIDSGTEVIGLDQTIDLSTDPSNPTLLTEVYEQSSCKLTIEYYDPNGSKLFDKIIDNQPLSFNLSSIPTEQYQDHILTKYNYNNKDYELNSDITLDKSEGNTATIKGYFKKNAFTVTFDYKDKESPEVTTKHIVEHCSKLTSENIPTPTKENFRFDGWADENGTKVNLLDKVVTDDVTYYATWVSSTTSFTVVFDLGAYQAEAKFKDTTDRQVKITGTDPILADQCPKPTCEGCAFLGWFTSEKETTTPTYPLTTSQTLYARFAPLYGYSTICLNVTEGGVFESTNTTSTLLTVINGTSWGSIISPTPTTSRIPTIKFTEDFKISGWSRNKEGTDPIKSIDTITEHAYLYSIVDDDVKDPSSFTGDNWPTLCAFADKGYTAMTASTSPYYSQWQTQGKKFTGLTKTLSYCNKEYTVKVAGDEDDYGNADRSKKLPVTFEFSEIITDSVFDDKELTETFTTYLYADSVIKNKLNKGGLIYNNISLSLIKKNHISTAYKFIGSSGTTAIECQMFIPSHKEININNTYTYSFIYDAYSSAGSSARKKKYQLIGDYCCYWVRDTNNSGRSTRYVEIDGNSASSEGNVSRGILPFFCIGLAE